MIHKPNFFVFTGGPGVGKTSLARHLQAMGETVVEETHRAVIAEQVAAGGRAVPWDDFGAYCELCVRRDIGKFDAMVEATGAQAEGRVFFDRSLIDGFDPRWAAPPDLADAPRNRRYNRRVFVFPPWREIYESDAERRQNWAEAQATFPRILEVLARFDYEPVIVPPGSLAERAAFVLDQVAQGPPVPR